ncbi:MAG: hypothetical protein E7394_02645 [Ruminococcaceae bacterium]|nr:hypothetical protein [Oscillospiraceae bacterium]
MEFNVFKIIEDFRNKKGLFIDKTFDDMKKMSSIVLQMLIDIKEVPFKCETTIYKTRNQIQPEITRLIKNFDGKYYSRSKARLKYANASIGFLKELKYILDLPCEPYSDLTCNSFLTLIEHRDYFTIYSYGEDTFLEKIRKLSTHYYRKVDDSWNSVCDAKTLIDNSII